MTDNEILQYGFLNGIIDIENIKLVMIMNERKKYLSKHGENYVIYQGKDKKWYTYLPTENESGRKRIRRTTEKDLEDAIIEYYKSLENEPTIGMVFNKWIESKLEYEEISKQSYDKYRSNYDRFFKNDFLNWDNKKLMYITEVDLEHFIKMVIVKLELSQKAYSDMRILINGIFKYAKKMKYTDISITNFFGDLQISKNSFKRHQKDIEDEVFLEDEIPLILDYLAEHGDIHSLGLIVAFQTGMRVGELSALKYQDIVTKDIKGKNEKISYIVVERTEVKVKNDEGKWTCLVQDYPKTEAGIRKIIITEKTLDVLKKARQYNPFGEYIFMQNGSRIRGSAFNKKLGRVCNALNINKRSMHKIRKTYGTTLIDNNVDDALVAEMMGHKDINTTKKYYYFSNKSESTKLSQMSKALANL